MRESGGLHIAMLCDGFQMTDPMDGIASYTARLSKDYVAMGHCVHVITAGDEERLDIIENVNVHTVLTGRTNFPILKGKNTLNKVLTNSYETMRKVAQLDVENRIDIVESPLWNAIGLMTAFLMPNIPMCVRLETPLKMVIRTQHWRESEELKLIEEMEESLIQRSDRVLYISDSIRRTVEELYDLNLTGKARRNYLGIEAGQLANRVHSSKVIIFFVGRLERRKGIHNLLLVIPKILEQYPDVEFRIAGDDSIVDGVINESFKENFQKTTKGRFAEKVKFLGKISKEEKEKELRECDIFVSPSLYESFGIVFLEAMRYGKVVIGCAAGGMKEIVEDGESGLLVAPDDAGSLKSALERLIDDAELRIKLGANAFLRVQKHFNNLRQAEEAISIYREAIECNNYGCGKELEKILREFALNREKNLR